MKLYKQPKQPRDTQQRKQGGHTLQSFPVIWIKIDLVI